MRTLYGQPEQSVRSPECAEWRGALQFACPSCHEPVTRTQSGWECPEEKIQFTDTHGIPSFILPHRRGTLENFLKGYNQIRRKEGWGSPNAEYYRCLPYKDLSKRYESIWRIRARTFDCFLDHLLRQVTPPHARVLDVGAGNCWCAARLTERGFEVVALDINIDPLDGLGVLSNALPGGANAIFPVRAEFDALPFGPGAFDVILFNASLHYSSDILRTLEQALVTLTPGGLLYILDSPLYKDAESGRMMLHEQKEKFRRIFGVSTPEEFTGSFLTYDIFEHIQKTYRVELLKPRYGLGWKLRPFIASVLKKREPATFRIIALHAPGRNQ